MLKMQILYLKLQTKDHYWSPAHSEVVFPEILIFQKQEYILL